MTKKVILVKGGRKISQTVDKVRESRDRTPGVLGYAKLSTWR